MLVIEEDPVPNEELESPVDKISEHINETAAHAREGWLKWSALLSVLFAVMAALSGLAAAHYANNAMIEQIQASDQWTYYQAKGIKAMLTETEQDTLRQLDKPLADVDQKLKKYHNEQQDIKGEATRLAEASMRHLEKHEVLSRTATLCQIAIAIMAIAVLTRRRYFVFISVLFGSVGLYFLLQSLILP
jgi:uncharacterized membrane protein YhhN